MIENFFKKIGVVHVVVFILVAFFSGVYVGFRNNDDIYKVTTLYNKEDNTIDSKTDFTPFWKAWHLIDEKSPNASLDSGEDRVYGAISGLMSSLNDPYSVFFKPDEAKIFEDSVAGNFSGVGMEVGIKDKILTVIAPLKNTPAYNAGIKSGDKILKIDKTLTSELSIDKAIKLIRGETGTTVTLTIFHEGDKEPREVKIVREVINIPTLDTEFRKDGVFVIRLYSFSANSADLFRKAIKEFKDSKSDKLVLDLRDNPGGYLESAVDISSWFLPEGDVVVTEDYGTPSASKTLVNPPKVYRSRGYNLFNDKLKFVILLNGGSASASEIVAGAMHDSKKAILVGEQSYGKGSVQEVVKLTPDTLLKITVAKWLTPNGTSISLKGLTPDYKVEITKEDVQVKKDPQLEKAVDLLLNWKI